MPIRFQAASIPRFLRTTQLGYLQLNAIVGSRLVQSNGGGGVYDIVMLPAQLFQRMRSNLGIMHIISPTPKPGAAFTPSFVPMDVREVSIPDDCPDPAAAARAHFIHLFGLEGEEEKAPSWAASVRETCAGRPGKKGTPCAS
jgi:hypothetical protein